MDSPQLSDNNINEVEATILETAQKHSLNLSAFKTVYSRIVKALNAEAIWERMAIALEAAPEPQIQQKIDRDGQKILAVYDPMTRCSLKFRTEEEFQIWYEQRNRNSSYITHAPQSTHSTWRRWNR